MKKTDQSVKNALRKAYQEAETFLPKKLSFDDIYNIGCHYRNTTGNKITYPYMCYWIPEERLQEILKEETSKYRKYWMWCGKNWDEKSLYEEELENLKKIGASYRTIEQWYKKMSEQWPLQKRSFDAETVAFNYFNYCPISNLETYNKLKQDWKSSSYAANIQEFLYAWKYWEESKKE